MKSLKEIIHYIIVPTEYKEIGGKLYVREGFGDFEEVQEHLHNEHPEAYTAYAETFRKKK